MEGDLGFYQLIGGSSKEWRIENYVEEYNKRHIVSHRHSVQYKMYRLKEDIARLNTMKASLTEVHKSQTQLVHNMRAFINTHKLNNVDVNQVFLKMKRDQYTQLDEMVKEGKTREQQLTSMQEYLDEFKLAYNAKRTTLIYLRKSASANLSSMFDAYLLLSSSSLSPSIVAYLFGHHYTGVIFSDVVLINEYMIKMAFDSLYVRTRDGRK